MRKLLVPVLAAVCILGVASAASAAASSTSKGATKNNAAHKMVGEVVSVDPAGHTLVIKETVKGGEAKEVTFNLENNVKVMSAGKTATLDSIKTGDSVTVHYTEKDGMRHATQLSVAKPAAPKTS